MTDLKKLLDEATPGVWQLDDFSCISAGFQGLFYYTNRDDGVHATNPADPALIVAAVNAVPELLALREEVGRLREALEAIFAERPAITDGLSQFQWECIRSIARAALNQEPGQ